MQKNDPGSLQRRDFLRRIGTVAWAAPVMVALGSRSAGAASPAFEKVSKNLISARELTLEAGKMAGEVSKEEWRGLRRHVQALKKSVDGFHRQFDECKDPPCGLRP